MNNEYKQREYAGDDVGVADYDSLYQEEPAWLPELENLLKDFEPDYAVEDGYSDQIDTLP